MHKRLRSIRDGVVEFHEASAGKGSAYLVYENETQYCWLSNLACICHI